MSETQFDGLIDRLQQLPEQADGRCYRVALPCVFYFTARDKADAKRLTREVFSAVRGEAYDLDGYGYHLPTFYGNCFDVTEGFIEDFAECEDPDE